MMLSRMPYALCPMPYARWPRGSMLGSARTVGSGAMEITARLPGLDVMGKSSRSLVTCVMSTSARFIAESDRRAISNKASIRSWAVETVKASSSLVRPVTCFGDVVHGPAQALARQGTGVQLDPARLSIVQHTNLCAQPQRLSVGWSMRTVMAG